MVDFENKSQLGVDFWSEIGNRQFFFDLSFTEFY